MTNTPKAQKVLTNPEAYACYEQIIALLDQHRTQYRLEYGEDYIEIMFTQRCNVTVYNTHTYEEPYEEPAATSN